MSDQNFCPLKKPMSYDEQVDHLRNSHGLIIPDAQQANAILQSVNYYRLSAYGIGLMDKQTGKFHEGVTIDEIFALYQFDCRLRNIISPVIEYIEIQMRSQISQLIAMKYGAEGHLDKNNFHSWYSKIKNKDMHDVFVDQLNAEINKQKRKPFVLHHNSKYGGHFPIWVAVELLTLGSLSTLYSIMKPEDQKIIAKFFSTNAEYMKSWFAALVELRNICAHYNRIYNMPLDSMPKLPKCYSQYVTNRVFSDLLAFKYVTKSNSVWKTFVASLVGAVDECEYLNLSFIGFPTDWQTIL